MTYCTIFTRAKKCHITFPNINFKKMVITIIKSKMSGDKYYTILFKIIILYNCIDQLEITSNIWLFY